MRKVKRGDVREAYIKGIRTALLVDDHFPTYLSALNGRHGRANEKERAKKLVSMCQKRNWLCDVESDIDLAERSRLHQSDLLILDYHLDPEDDRDPSKALNVIKNLSQTPYFNLVIIYTADPKLDEVALDVAFRLGAGGQAISDEERERINDAIEEEEEVGTPAPVPSKKAVISFLRGKFDRDFMAEVRRVYGSGPDEPKFAQCILENYFQRRASDLGDALKVRGQRAVFEAPETDNKLRWVQSGNVFVVIESKETGPNRLIGKLEKALEEWCPSPVHLILAHAKEAIEKGGVRQNASILNDPIKEAAWMFHALSKEGPAEHEEKIGQLYSGLFEALGNSVTADVAKFGAQLLRPVEAKKALKSSQKLARLPASTPDFQIVHKLNEFLSTTKFVGDRITTGVIFRSVAAGSEENYWVCVSPACSMVLGQWDEWEKSLEPTLPVSALRLTPTKSELGQKRILEKATHCRQLFLKVDGTPISLAMMSDEARETASEKIFLDDHGKVSVSGAFSGRRVRKNGDGDIEFVPTSFEAVAVLRAEYANRSLSKHGQHETRVGVDFVNLPS